MKIILIIIGIIFLTSCNPRIFNILEKDIDKRLSIYYLGKLDNVKKINDNSFSLHDSSLAVVKIFGVTSHIIEFNTKNLQNQNFRINFRNIFDKYNYENGISIEVKNNFYSIYIRKKMIKSGILNIDFNFFYIENDGKYLKLKVNCDDIYLENLDLYSTEYMIIENFENSSFEISGFNWENLNFLKKLNN